MKIPSRRSKQQPPSGWNSAGTLARRATPWLWLLACLIFYAPTGMVLAAFPCPYWVWMIGLGAVFLQVVALAGPRSLARFRWWFANGLVLIAILGAGGLAVALAIALGFAGSASLDEMAPHQLAIEVMQYAVVALALAALCAGITAATGDRLMAAYRRPQTSLILMATCVLGLALGGLAGLSLA